MATQQELARQAFLALSPEQQQQQLAGEMSGQGQTGVVHGSPWYVQPGGQQQANPRMSQDFENWRKMQQFNAMQQAAQQQYQADQQQQAAQQQWQQQTYNPWTGQSGAAGKLGAGLGFTSTHPQGGQTSGGYIGGANQNQMLPWGGGALASHSAAGDQIWQGGQNGQYSLTTVPSGSMKPISQNKGYGAVMAPVSPFGGKTGFGGGFGQGGFGGAPGASGGGFGGQGAGGVGQVKGSITPTNQVYSNQQTQQAQNLARARGHQEGDLRYLLGQNKLGKNIGMFSPANYGRAIPQQADAYQQGAAAQTGIAFDDASANTLMRRRGQGALANQETSLEALLNEINGINNNVQRSRYGDILSMLGELL